MNEKWLQDIRNRMNNYETDAPEGLWEDVRCKLNPVQPSTPMVLRHIWIGCSACVAAIILCVFLLQKQDVIVPADEHPADIVVSLPALDSQPEPAGERLHTTVPNPILAVANSYLETDGYQSDIHEGSIVTAPEELEIHTDTVIVSSENIQRKNTGSSYYTQLPRKRNGKKDPDSRWSVGISTSGSLNASSSMLATAIPVAGLGPDNSIWEDDPLLGIAVYNQGKSVKYDIHHRLPVRLGLSVQHELSDRLSLETGLTYTRLVSDIVEGTVHHNVNSEQQLNYIGIPANVKYRVCSLGLISIYASSGVLLEKMVAGNMVNNYTLNGQSQDSQKSSINDKPYQCSVNTAMGVQCHLLSGLSLYVEPGLSYYFNDGSSLETIYKEKPLNFNLNMGLRFNL